VQTLQIHLCVLGVVERGGGCLGRFGEDFAAVGFDDFTSTCFYLLIHHFGCLAHGLCVLWLEIIHFLLTLGARLDISCSHVVLAVWTQCIDKVSVTKLHINISVVPPDPVLDVFFHEISTEIEALDVDSQVITVDGSMCVLVNMPEDLEHAVVFSAHKLLFLSLDALYGVHFFLEDLDQAMLYIVVDILKTVVESVGELLFSSGDMLSLGVAVGANHHLETKGRTKL
jgi:hypothetical protein